MISLFYFIIVITFLNSNISKIVSFLFSRFCQSIATQENQKRKESVKAMLHELSEINMTDEWAKYAKLQRKINKENDLINQTRSEEAAKLDGLITNWTWILRLCLGLTLTITVLFNRSTVVTKLPQDWLWPFQSLICWSKEIPGGVTTPCWVIISSSVSRSLARFL